ncbi:MAG TPA: ATP-binding cassette domain-containing protein [Pseudonocardia sp.]|uniref:ATP-binding cassette domain-containing protein n=1 Tax=Pseudonocardia sp. TaxID=60912 RepID=UPI002B4B890A|nr:ATP-binding cassette domain-containing protein [Pseudonocardia sp.]HLU57024.1 ATP-binding cassette domain-containing protein [Pseudonocardia sp.]
MIRARGLTKRYGAVLAVDDLSFDVGPGAVTGFLGANGAGKSTTMRMTLGLDAPTAGSVTVAGRAYRDLPSPVREVGALLDPRCMHPGRSARAHLRWMADAAGIRRSRVEEVLELVGVAHVADRRVGTFSLGMRQRVGIAGALLGDPGVLLLDEPLNGLDPEGIRWLRTLLRDLAHEGRTVFVSSHLLHEMEQVAQRVVVIARGRLVDEFEVGRAAAVRVRPADAGLVAALRAAGAEVTAVEGGLEVRGVPAHQVGELALEHRVALHELVERRDGLEEAYLALTRAGAP